MGTCKYSVDFDVVLVSSFDEKGGLKGPPFSLTCFIHWKFTILCLEAPVWVFDSIVAMLAGMAIVYDMKKINVFSISFFPFIYSKLIINDLG